MSTKASSAKITEDLQINIISPLNGRTVGQVAATPVEAIADLAQKARSAQVEWAALPLKSRVKIVRRLAPILAAEANSLVEILHTEVGRYRTESWFAEVVPNIDLIGWWTKKGVHALEPSKISLNPINFPGKKAQVQSIPRGVLGLITPWNYPVSIPLRTIVPAVLAGNALLWKPSEYAALTSKRLYEALAKE